MLSFPVSQPWLLLTTLKPHGVPSITTDTYHSTDLWYHAPVTVTSSVQFSLFFLMYVWTEKYVCSSFDSQTSFWINNLLNQSHWHSSKTWRPVWRGTARMLLRWPFMSMAAAQLSCIFYLSSPLTYTNSNIHVLLCVIEREFNLAIFRPFLW